MSPKKRIRVVNGLPTLFTLGNLVCGFFAIVVAARVAKPERPIPADPDAVVVERANTEYYKHSEATHCMYSAALIFLAMVFDALDGQVARLSRTSSEFGAQLDSLCDLVSFGVAPAFLLVKMCPDFTAVHNEPVWVLAATFAVCVALRLARYNVETDEEDDHRTFSGLPSPAGGAAVASFAFLFYSLRREGEAIPYAADIDLWLQWLLPWYALIVAVLMVSRIPYPHIANHLFRGEKTMGQVVGLLIALVFLALARGYAIPVVCGVFAVSGPVNYVWQRLWHRRPQEDPLF
jgi:CDP-diacylglycerol--serine O-phosphatidyltransferase